MIVEELLKAFQPQPFGGIAFVLFAFAALAIVSRLIGREPVIQFKDVKVGLTRWSPPASTQERTQLEHAFERHTDVLGGLGAVIDAPTDAAATEALSRWFDLLCQNLAWALKTETAEDYRVAVWADEPEGAAEFTGVAWYRFDANDVWSHSLPKKATIAGVAFASGQPYYCRDTEADTTYVQRRPKQYHSIYAAVVGEPAHPWGVITVDARAVDGFTVVDQEIVRRFAALARLGAYYRGL